MRCPYCEPAAELPIRELHAHLADDHADRVRVDEQGERSLYSVTCPYCEDQYRQQIRKSVKDTGFVAEFERQIRLVAFDMLINHLLAEHELTVP